MKGCAMNIYTISLTVKKNSDFIILVFILKWLVLIKTYRYGNTKTLSIILIVKLDSALNILFINYNGDYIVVVFT